MKKLLSITLLIIAVLLGSCKEESEVSRIEKGTTKSVKGLSYTFSTNARENTVKSGNLPDSTKVLSPIERKVLSVETLELGGETFIASLIEENDLIETKATNPQVVDGSSIYTFYAYKDSEIREQFVSADSKKFQVPKDNPTNYGIIFLSSAIGMENPKQVTQITNKTINTTPKTFTYKAIFNENVCYASFDKVTMPPGNPIDVTFTPVFSQLGISVPSKVTGTTITVEKVRLVSGGQQEATVKVVYNSNATNNIDVSYNDNLANYEVDLTHKLNPIDNITYLYPNGEDAQHGYYNIIPNGKPAQVYIEMTATGITGTKKETIEFKDAASKPISFSSGKRYTIKIENGVTPKIEITPADNTNLVAQSYTLGEPITLKYGLTQQLKATAVYPDGTREDITKDAGTTWSYVGTEDGQTQITDGASVDNTDKKGLVTLIKVGTSKITATYKGGTGTATIKPDIHRIFKATDYYQWDAYMPYDINNPNGTTPPWGPGSSSFHSGDGVKPVTDKFKSTPTNNETMKYLGNGCNFSGTDGLIYTVEPDGTSGKKLYCSGAWFKKSAYWSASATPTSEIESSPQGRPTVSEAELNEKYFYLPLCGDYSDGKFSLANVDGFYWLRDSYNDHIVKNGIDYELSYSLRIFSSGKIVLLGLGGSTSYNRNNGLVPLEGFDDSFIVPTSIVLTANPNSIKVGESSSLKAVVNYSNGTHKINPQGISFTSSNTSVIPNPGTTASAKGNAVGYSDITASITENGRTVKSDAVRITVTAAAAAVPTEILSFTANPTSILVGGKSNLTVKVKYSDGTTKTNPSGITFTSNNTGVIPSPGTATTATGYAPGAAVITAKFGSLPTKTVTITVAIRSYTADDYYMWDAPKGVYYNSTYPNNNYSNITSGVASRSCANAPTYYEIQMYLAAGVYWVEDGPAYKLPDGNTYRTGLMVKKSDKINGFKDGTADMVDSVYPTTGVPYEALKDDYFFLPACGDYRKGRFNSAGAHGLYWSSTPDASDTNFAYCLYFFSDIADAINLERRYGFVPMPRL